MANHKVDNYWAKAFRVRERKATRERLTKGTIRFEESRSHPFHRLVKREELRKLVISEH
jgi:hypothetical protein